MFLITSTKLAQCPPAFAVYMIFLSCGILISWSSPMIPKLQAKNSPIPVTNQEGSWIVSVMGLSGVIAPILGILTDRFGRKPMLIASAVPIIINWIMTIFATSAAELVATRAIAGIGFNCIFLAGPMYIGEIAQEDIRGILGRIEEDGSCSAGSEPEERNLS
ncbi:hypothetical protein C0J52_01838 [Blattella germanica]|nr:hypothetical protein C0J52_01838 [Blattella germanica]